MGITRDQIAKGALNRLRDHYENMVKLDAKGDRESVNRFDAEAWAFARTLITSHDLLGLIHHVVYAFNTAIILEDETGWEEHNAPNPMWGLDALELLVRGYVLLDSRQDGHDQWSDLNASYDAIEMLDDWGWRVDLKTALLYVSDEQFVEWGGRSIDEQSWLGYRNHLERFVPRIEVEKLLRAIRADREKEA